MPFSSEVLDQIRFQTDMVELVSRSVPGLKKAGKHWKACCPFHQEKTPSFVVSPEKGIFHCFGCGKGGDAFQFLMAMEGMNFTESVRALAELSHVVLQEERQALTQDQRERRSLFDALEYAAQFYEETLWSSPGAQKARSYLAARGLEQETLKKFHVGFAPADGRSLLQAALKKGFNAGLLQKAGLANLSQDGRTLRDQFWGRVIFPIQDAKGQTVAFGGRVLDETLPKYINSPETPLYVKSRHLYGLPQAQAALRDGQSVVIMEGYIDVVSAHQHGVTNAVAPLGTALTPDQVKLLKRYTEHFVMAYDGDKAGLDAALRGASVVLENGGLVRLAQIPEGLDPDEYLRTHGLEKFRGILAASFDLMEFELARLSVGSGLRLEERLSLAQRLMPLVTKAANELQKSEWIRLLAERLGLDPQALNKELKRRKIGTAEESAPARAIPAAVQSGEEELLGFLLQHPEFRKPFQGTSFTFDDVRCLKVMELWLEQTEEGGAGTFQKILAGLDEPIGKWFAALLLEEKSPPSADPKEYFEGLLDFLHRQKLEHKRRGLAALVSLMAEGQTARDEKTIEEFQTLTKYLKGSKPT